MGYSTHQRTHRRTPVEHAPTYSSLHACRNAVPYSSPVGETAINLSSLQYSNDPSSLHQASQKLACLHTSAFRDQHARARFEMRQIGPKNCSGRYISPRYKASASSVAESSQSYSAASLRRSRRILFERRSTPVALLTRAADGGRCFIRYVLIICDSDDCDSCVAASFSLLSITTSRPLAFNVSHWQPGSQL